MPCWRALGVKFLGKILFCNCLPCATFLSLHGWLVGAACLWNLSRLSLHRDWAETVYKLWFVKYFAVRVTVQCSENMTAAVPFPPPSVCIYENKHWVLKYILVTTGISSMSVLDVFSGLILCSSSVSFISRNNPTCLTVAPYIFATLPSAAVNFLLLQEQLTK